MHPEAITKIENKIRGSLKNCLVANNWPQFESFSVHVDSLAKEILKHKKEWLDVVDIFSIYYDLVYEAITAVVLGEEQLNGNLWDLLWERKVRRS